MPEQESNDTRVELARLSATLDAWVQGQRDWNMKHERSDEDQWRAINKLKVDTAKWAGFAAAAGALLGGGLPKLLALLGA